MDSLEIFRNQEIDRFNILINTLMNTLRDLQMAILGQFVMSLDLELMFSSFLNQKVPALWEKVSYLSLKPLGSWVNDFIQRVEFFQEWIRKGTMDSYWVSAFFFPQGFMTANL